jgi:MFS family permease
LLPWTAVTLVVIPLAGAVSDRIGNRTLVVAGLLLQAIGFAWIAVVAHPAVGYGALIVPLLAAGVGVSLVMPAVANAVVGGVTPQELGLASATNTAFRQLGAPFGVAVVTAVFQQAGGFTSPQAFTDGLTAALAVAAAMSVAGAVVGLRVAGRPRAPRVAKVAASSAAA